MNEQNQEKTYNLRISSKNKYNPITKYAAFMKEMMQLGKK